MAQRETENNAYAKFGVQTKSIMVCYGIFFGMVNRNLITWSHLRGGVNRSTYL